MTVNRARLRSLSGDDLARLASAGDLDLVYAHLASQHNFTPTADRILRVVAPVRRPKPLPPGRAEAYGEASSRQLPKQFRLPGGAGARGRLGRR